MTINRPNERLYHELMCRYARKQYGPAAEKYFRRWHVDFIRDEIELRYSPKLSADYHMGSLAADEHNIHS